VGLGGRAAEPMEVRHPLSSCGSPLSRGREGGVSLLEDSGTGSPSSVNGPTRQCPHEEASVLATCRQEVSLDRSKSSQLIGRSSGLGGVGGLDASTHVSCVLETGVERPSPTIAARAMPSDISRAGANVQSPGLHAIRTVRSPFASPPLSRISALAPSSPVNTPAPLAADARAALQDVVAQIRQHIDDPLLPLPDMQQGRRRRRLFVADEQCFCQDPTSRGHREF
jgi:hypothetical protein